MLVATFGAASAQELIVPNYFDAKERLQRPNTQDIFRLRFLTTVDFPPFGFLDQTGRLTGFHVELAREICEELNIVARCQIQALEWTELQNALKSDEGDALIAGLAVNERAREDLLFSRTYMELPARFLKPKEQSVSDVMDLNKDDQMVAVLKGTAHELMLASWFPDLKSKSFEGQEEMFKAILDGQVSAIFSDGLQLSFWQKSEAAKGCCEFWGGPYISRSFLGEGLAIAVPKSKPDLVGAINYGLSKLSQNGRFEELYLRYFPSGIY